MREGARLAFQGPLSLSSLTCEGRIHLALGCAGSSPSEVVTGTLERRGCLSPWQRGRHWGCVCTKGGVRKHPHTGSRNTAVPWPLCLGTAAGRCLSLSERPWPPPMLALQSVAGCLLAKQTRKESCAACTTHRPVLAHPSCFHASSNHTHHTKETKAKRGKEACPKLWCGVTCGASEAELAHDRIPVFPFTSSVSVDESLSL